MTYNEMWRSLCCLYEENEAKSIVRTMLDDLFGMSLTDIICGATESLTTEENARLTAAMERLRAAEPVQYVTGNAPFAGRHYHVEPGVLIPRPETETLCAAAMEKVKAEKPRLLDVGTGSGCIACTLALDIPRATVTAWDISADAIRIASGNAERLGAKNIVFERQDALTPPAHRELWDVVVSNPPYICMKEKQDMERNVLENEPHIALFVPDDDPLLFYRAIATYALQSLKSGGWLIFEINPLYARITETMLKEKGYVEINTITDDYGKPRVTSACKP